MKTRTGGVQRVKGRPYMRIRIGKSQRESVSLSGCTSDADVEARALLIADVSNMLLEAGRADKVKDIASQIGAATQKRKIDAAVNAASLICKTGERPRGELTFGEHAESWFSGDLARRFPSYIKMKSSAKKDRGLYKKWIAPHLAKLPIGTFTLDHGLGVMSLLPADMSRASRRHVAQVMYRLVRLAVFPCRVLAASPLPVGFLPKLGAERPTSILYPAEEAKLMACKAIPLPYRIYWGVLAREGMRSSELGGGDDDAQDPLSWTDVDLDHGALRLDKNKTDRARTWAMDPGVTRALTRWKELSGGKASGPVVDVRAFHRADLLREHLLAAGVDRHELHHGSKERDPINVHSLRGTFVTLALANGKTETWVQDRTGHTSSTMINRYRRQARTAAELGLGTLTPLDDAIPELGQTKSARGTKKAPRANTGQTAKAEGKKTKRAAR